MTEETVLSQLGRLVQQRAGAQADPDTALLADFVSAYFTHVREEQLGNRSAVELLAAAGAHFELARQRQADETLVSVVPLNDSQQGCDMTVMTVTADRPFIVDTVLMAVRDTDARIDWVVHPVLRLTRDDTGRLTRVAGRADRSDHGDEESLVRVEFSVPAGFDGRALVERIEASMADLAVVVDDHEPMRRQLHHVIDLLEGSPDIGEGPVEVQTFLRWLDDHHFTWLGYRRQAVSEDGTVDDGTLNDVPGSSLGLLREDRPGLDPDGYVAPSEELDKYVQSSRILVVAKANKRAWIHHPEPMDVIAVKQRDEDGRTVAAHRFLGLFSADAYAESPRDIPVLRQKVRHILDHAGFKPGSHDAKSLAYIFETFPRDELFQSSESELFDTALSVLAMRESEPLRLFMRRDRYGRFYSCLVYLPRDHYSPTVRQLIVQELEQHLNGRMEESDAAFLRADIVRLHCQIGTTPGADPIEAGDIEPALTAATRGWPDAFVAAAAADGRRVTAYAHAFPAEYTARNRAADAVADARVLARLAQDSGPILTLSMAEDDQVLWLKVFGVGTETPLSDVLPVLENFGLAIQTQRPFVIHAPSGHAQWIHEFEAIHPQAHKLQDDGRAADLSRTFALVRTGRAEDDILNRLVIDAGLNPREIVLVRTITRYLLQTQLPFSVRYLETLLADHGDVVAHMLALFDMRLNPDGQAEEQQQHSALIQTIETQFDEIVSLDADRALRAFLGVVQAVLRTNYYQPDDDGNDKPYVSIKLDPAHVPELPQPLPAFETFVYSPEVEGIHLRGGLVARGGIRWSDRREDFRTEVLGLMKAQMVKNAVIVPVGAKGGFVVKNAPSGEDRETRQARGVAAYKTFNHGLLDVTDNRVGDDVVHPQRVVRHDGDDPYLVVAADKGTASFSDIANGLSRAYGYWLDDAYASGGSAGYDHKAMGITARGGWESVKRHFREMGHDTQREPFTVVGIGDMAGDVFGNGMLMSEHIRLIGAFNHMHIFIDPDPDPAVGYAERKRLFELPRSAWSDYDKSLLSKGGDIHERSAKLVELSDEAMQALGIRTRRLTPDDLIREMLKAPVDLVWNGGIGTYVKAHHESDADVGDHGNDSVRVDGRDLRCKVVGEGGNLGMTQAGRIEYALKGGRLNTDAIDNSGGVDSSDLEVNIKIALGTVEATGELTREDRNTLLHGMTENVVDLVLRTNYLQTQQLSLLEADSVTRFDEQIDFMRTLERSGQVDRAVEGLPDEDTIAERRRNRQGLTRPELAILLSHAKVALADAVIDSDLPDDPYFEAALIDGFPQPMRDSYAEALRHHRLKRELIATLVTNQMVDRLGVAMAHRMATDHGVRLADTVRAYVLADAWLGAQSLYEAIEALDNRIETAVQYALLKRVTALVKHAMSWQLTEPADDAAMVELVDRYQAPTRQLLARLPDYMTGRYAHDWQERHDEAAAAGLDAELAVYLASADVGGGLLDIVVLADDRDADVADVARVYFELGNALGFAWLQRAIQALHVDGRWPAMARSRMRGDCYRIHRRLVALVLDAGGNLAAWCDDHADDLEVVQARIDELRAVDKPAFAHLTVAVRDLAQLCETHEKRSAP